MPRPRFLKLPEEKRTQILDAARAEFSEHGYADASQNRIIEAAGVSKGAMYYYFDDKDDLYVTVIRREMLGLEDTLSLGDVVDAEGFWTALGEAFVRSMDFLGQSEERFALARSVARTFGQHNAPPGALALLEELHGATAAVVVLGQRVGAVRDDLPQQLLVAMALKLGEAMDLWFAEHFDELDVDAFPALNQKMVDLFRRLAAP